MALNLRLTPNTNLVPTLEMISCSPLVVSVTRDEGGHGYCYLLFVFSVISSLFSLNSLQLLLSFADVLHFASPISRSLSILIK